MEKISAIVYILSIMRNDLLLPRYAIRISSFSNRIFVSRVQNFGQF